MKAHGGPAAERKHDAAPVERQAARVPSSPARRVLAVTAAAWAAATALGAGAAAYVAAGRPLALERIEGGRAVAQLIVDPLSFRDRFALQQAVRAAARHPAVAWAAVTDAADVVQAHTDLSRLETTLATTSGIPLASRDGCRAVATILDGHPVAWFRCPIGAGVSGGALHVAYRAELAAGPGLLVFFATLAWSLLCAAGAWWVTVKRPGRA